MWQLLIPYTNFKAYVGNSALSEVRISDI